MAQPHPTSRFGPDYTPTTVSVIASCSAMVSALDARVSCSPVASAWCLRSAWSGYAQALRLQGVEIDEIDAFLWGCGLRLPDRPFRTTHLDEFADFGDWHGTLLSEDTLAWRDSLPTAIFEPPDAIDHPGLVRAVDRIRQYSRLNGTVAPWLGLPFALRDQGLSALPLPCLAGGAIALRLKRRPSDADWIAIFRSIQAAAKSGLDRLTILERLYRDAQRAIVHEFRPGALPSLAALAIHRPLLSPQFVSETLGLSVGGASKLLERGVSCGIVIEITQRASWRVFLATDLAVEFGYARPKRGRPLMEPPPLPASRDLTAVFDAFDQEMAEINHVLSRL